MKQKGLLAKLQTNGLDISATSLSRLEGQYRVATNIEVLAVAEALNTDVYHLLGKKGLQGCLRAKPSRSAALAFYRQCSGRVAAQHYALNLD